MYLFGKLCRLSTIVSSLSKRTSINYMIQKCFFCQQVFTVNTNVTKDVMLYKYINDRNFKIGNFFALCNFGFWTYLSLFAYGTLRDAPVEKTNEEVVWWRKINLGENKYRNGLMIVTFAIGQLNLFINRIADFTYFFRIQRFSYYMDVYFKIN